MEISLRSPPKNRAYYINHFDQHCAIAFQAYERAGNGDLRDEKGEGHSWEESIMLINVSQKARRNEYSTYPNPAMGALKSEP